MKKTILFGILILILTLPLAQSISLNKDEIIYHDELKKISQTDLSDLLNNNLNLIKTTENNEKIYYYYQTKTIEPLKDGTYIIKNLDLQTSIPKKDFQSCINENSENYCLENLIQSDNKYVVEVNARKDPLFKKSIKNQLDEQINLHLNKIKQNKNLEGDFPTRPEEIIQEEIVEEIIPEEEPIIYPQFTSFEEMLLSLISYDSTTGTYKIGAISLNPDGSILVQNDLTVLGNIYSNQTIENTSIIQENNPTEIQLPQTYLLEDQDIVLNLSE